MFFRNRDDPQQRSFPFETIAFRSAKMSASSIKCVVSKITWKNMMHRHEGWVIHQYSIRTAYETNFTQVRQTINIFHIKNLNFLAHLAFLTALQQTPKLPARVSINPSCWLVQKYKLWVSNQSYSYWQFPLLSTYKGKFK